MQWVRDNLLLDEHFLYLVDKSKGVFEIYTERSYFGKRIKKRTNRANTGTPQPKPRKHQPGESGGVSRELETAGAVAADSVIS